MALGCPVGVQCCNLIRLEAHLLHPGAGVGWDNDCRVPTAQASGGSQRQPDKENEGWGWRQVFTDYGAQCLATGMPHPSTHPAQTPACTNLLATVTSGPWRPPEPSTRTVPWRSTVLNGNSSLPLPVTTTAPGNAAQWEPHARYAKESGRRKAHTHTLHNAPPPSNPRTPPTPRKLTPTPTPVLTHSRTTHTTQGLGQAGR
jgi:hypothetical protein